MSIIKGENLVFKETEDDQLKADVCYPADGEKHPGIILIHGGAWLQGYKEMYREWVPFLAEQGYVTMAIDYRLATLDVSAHPGAVNDVKSAVQFLVQHAEEWQIDTNHMVLIGDSAGAQLASSVAIDSAGDSSYHIAAVIDIYGVYDLPAWQQYTSKMRSNDPVHLFIGASLHDAPDKYEEASPYYKIKTLESSFDTSFFIIWGNEDHVVPASQSEAFSLLLEQKGFDVQTLVIPDKGHFWFNLFEGSEGGSLIDYPNPLVSKNILNYLERKLSK